MEKMKDDFEMLWLERRKRILAADDEYRKATDGYKMTGGADWLLFGTPVVAAIVFLDYSPLDNEWLNWLAGAAIALVLFVVAVYIKSAINGTRSPVEVEEDIKRRCRERYERTGKID